MAAASSSSIRSVGGAANTSMAPRAKTLTVPVLGSGQPSSANSPTRMAAEQVTSSRTAAVHDHASLFDGTHITTLYERIIKLSDLVVQASDDANSLSMRTPNVGASTEGDVAMLEAADVPTINAAPTINIALGATTDDDVDAGYEAALFATQARRNSNAKPTELAQTIVREGVALRQAFKRAHDSVEHMPGGEMDIDEQQHLLTMLRAYSEEQDRLRVAFEKNSTAFVNG